jgi:DnaJ family protein C protein 17
LLKSEIERLRKQGSQQLAEEQEKIRQELANEKKQASNVIVPGRLKVSWKINPEIEDVYSYDKLYSILQKYGNINALIISSKKKGSAIVEFANKNDANLAYSVEKGLMSCPLTLSWIQGDHQLASSTSLPVQQPSAPQAPVAPTVKVTSMADFEAQVLKSMREAQERKRKLESANGSTS